MGASAFLAVTIPISVSEIEQGWGRWRQGNEREYRKGRLSPWQSHAGVTPTELMAGVCLIHSPKRGPGFRQRGV